MGRRQKMTLENALKYHVEMWSDMQRDLGDNPSYKMRAYYKDNWCRKWIKEHPEYKCSYRINADCFLCEYITSNNLTCSVCPVVWDSLAENPTKEKVDDFLFHPEAISCCSQYGNMGSIHAYAPISEILNLPFRIERELFNGQNK